jgi:hypothetical protein
VVIPENFEMREEYFMNYDFLRKHGDKIDRNGKCFRMLDFEDGGMYFGIVEDELPSGLGAFVYSDLKFHCGYYSGGLMNDMSRIHFGNGDVFDGMTEAGKMHGEGFFFDCENNDWVFGLFEADNCIEVIEHGEGFPRAEISKFRSLYHQSGQQYYGRETEPLLLDLDLLIEYANRDISHLRPEITPISERNDHDEEPEDLGLEEEMEHAEEEEDADEEQEEDYHTEKASLQARNHSNRRTGMETTAIDDKKFTSQGRNIEAKKISLRGQGPTRKDSNLTKRIHISAPRDDHNSASGYNSRKAETDFNPVERRMLLIPEVNTVSPGLMEAETLRTPIKGAKEVLKKTPGNQIVQGANPIKPKTNINHKETSAITQSDIDGGHQHSKLSHNLRLNDISGVSSVRDRDESRDLRNISIQTEDKHADTYYKNDEASLSYLKGIHSMIDELKQMVNDKIVVGRETEKVEESILFKITEVKKQVEQSLSAKNYPPFLENHVPVMAFHPGSVLGNLNLGSELGSETLHGYRSEGPGLPPETRLPLAFNSVPTTQTGNQWNMTIDQMLEEKRFKDIEEALAKKFGKSEEQEKQHSEVLEPIKESADAEEDEELNNGRNSKVENKVLSQQRINFGTLWDGSYKPGSTEEPSLQKPKGSAQEEIHTETIQNVKNYEKKEQERKFEGRGPNREPIIEEITEADQKNFYTGEPMWGEERRKSSWGGQGEENGTFNTAFPFTGFRNVESQQVEKVELSVKSNSEYDKQNENLKNIQQKETYGQSEVKEKSVSFGHKMDPNQQPKVLSQDHNIPDTDRNRDSNFMYSRKGNESCNNGSLLPGLTSHNGKGSSVTPWFFLNPYLYEASYDIDVTQY